MKTLTRPKKTKAKAKKTVSSSWVLQGIRNDPKLNFFMKGLREHPFTQSLIDNTFSNDAYYTYLANLLPIYSILEDKFMTLSCFGLKEMQLSEEYKFLFRTPRIYEDVMSYKATISSYAKHHNPRMYNINWVQNMRMRNPRLLACEFYIRMMGDLHGSKTICTRLRFNQMFSFRDTEQKIKIVENLITIALKDFSPLEICTTLSNAYSFHLNFLNSLHTDFNNEMSN
jgi:hypothetical protein